MFSDCKHPEERLTHTCRMPCCSYKPLLLTAAQHRIRVQQDMIYCLIVPSKPSPVFWKYQALPRTQFVKNNESFAPFIIQYLMFFFLQSEFFSGLGLTTFSACSNKHSLIIITGELGNQFHKASLISSLWRKKRYAELAVLFSVSQNGVCMPPSRWRSLSLLQYRWRCTILWNIFKMAVR